MVDRSVRVPGPAICARHRAHHYLDIAILGSHGLLIFLLFSWVTASHATLTIFHSNIEHP